QTIFPDFAAAGYQEKEFFIEGDANSFTSTTPLTSDGLWNNIQVNNTAHYKPASSCVPQAILKNLLARYLWSGPMLHLALILMLFGQSLPPNAWQKKVLLMYW